MKYEPDYRDRPVTAELIKQISAALVRVRAAIEGATGAPADAVHDEAVVLAVRVLFLLYAEGRYLMPVDDPVYRDRLGLSALFERLERHADPASARAYEQLPRLFRAVFEGAQFGELVLPARGGKLFDPDAHPLLERASMDDVTVRDLLRAMIVVDGGRASYRDLPVEIIGSVYESLMSRKSRHDSGSHYTPRDLVEIVARRAIEQLIDLLGRRPSAGQILSLRIADPAVGSGAFLLYACRFLAGYVVDAWARDGYGIATVNGCPLSTAKRIVAEQCLFGVDKNPSAVEICRLSLWLETGAADRPFTFLDHAIHHGDALVGLDISQIRGFHWLPSDAVAPISAVVDAAHAKARLWQGRALIASYWGESPEELRLYHTFASQAIEPARLIADACVGAFFAESKPKAREAERKRRLSVVGSWLAGDGGMRAQVEAWARDARERLRPFHWDIEFAEEGPFEGDRLIDAFIGNPPFLGGTKISGAFGRSYLDWLLTIHDGSHGNADLSAHFLRRAASLLGSQGTLSFIATNTISQGDTRQTGLKRLVDDGLEIVAADRSIPWPGDASVSVSTVTLIKGFWLTRTPYCGAER